MAEGGRSVWKVYLPVIEVVLLQGTYCWQLCTAWGYACLDCIFYTLLSQQLPWSGQGNTQNMYYNDETLMITTSSGRMTSSVELHVVRTMESGFPAATVRLHTHTYTLMTHCLNNTIHCASFKIAKAR